MTSDRTSTASPSRRRRHAFAVALSLGASSLAVFPSGRARAQATPMPTPTATAVPTGSPCAVIHQMSAAPDFVPLGAAVSVTASARIICHAQEVRHHIVLVLDSSGSMSGANESELRSAGRTFVDSLDLDANPSTAVGVVVFGNSAKILCHLTNRASQANGCIGRLGASGGSCIDCGIKAGLGVLARGRTVSGDRPLETMIVVADGPNNSGCPTVLGAASTARNDGVRVFMVCLGEACDRTCLGPAASDPAYFHPVSKPAQLTPTFEVIRQQLLGAPPPGPVVPLAVADLTLAVRPAPGMRIVDGSQSPAAPILDADGLGWHFGGPGSDAVTVTFQVRPEVAGDMPVVAAADATYVDGAGRLGLFGFDVPRVVVSSGGALPTATPGAPSTIRTQSLRLSPIQPRNGQRWRLDYQLQFNPPQSPLGSHVMVVADASGSMSGEANRALKAALHDLALALPLGVDPSVRMGLIAFDGAARVLVDLTDRRAAIDEAIGLLGAGGGSCLDCGLTAGRAALAAARPAGYEDLVLIADGLNGGGCDLVRREADAAKAERISVHTVCLVAGGCDTSCLVAAASPGQHHAVAALDDLAPSMRMVSDVLAADRRYASVGLTLHLPPHLRLVPDSAVPPPITIVDTATASWHIQPVPRGGIMVTAELEAVSDGDGVPVMHVEVRPRSGLSERGAVEADALPAPTATPLAPPTAGVADRVYLPVASRSR